MNTLQGEWRDDFEKEFGSLFELSTTSVGTIAIDRSYYSILFQVYISAKKVSQSEIDKRDELIQEAIPWVDNYRCFDSVSVEEFKAVGKWIEKAKKIVGEK